MPYDGQTAVVCLRHRPADRQGGALLFVFPFFCVRIQGMDNDLRRSVSSLLRILKSHFKKVELMICCDVNNGCI